ITTALHVERQVIRIIDLNIFSLAIRRVVAKFVNKNISRIRFGYFVVGKGGVVDSCIAKNIRYTRKFNGVGCCILQRPAKSENDVIRRNGSDRSEEHTSELQSRFDLV